MSTSAIWFSVRRVGLIAVVVGVAVAGCKKKSSENGPGSQPPPSITRQVANFAVEQERFDRERQPELLVTALGLAPGKQVADIGAGSGLVTIHLAKAVKPGGRVVATDVDRGVMGLLTARLEAAGLQDVVERRPVPPDDPGLAPDTFDAILLSEVDNYLLEPEAWLRVAARQLRPGGRLVITNRVHHRAKALAAAAAAGLTLVSESSPTPSHFIAVFTTENQ